MTTVKQLVAYRIVDWADTFENNRSRTVKVLRWCPIPNRFDGDKISELIERGGDGVYGAWCAFCLVCSRSAERGVALKKSGIPHTPKSLSRITGLSAESFTAMLRIACLPEVALLEAVETDHEEEDTDGLEEVQREESGQLALVGAEPTDSLATKRAAPVPYAKVYDLFAELCPSLGQPRIRDDNTRRKNIRGLWGRARAFATSKGKKGDEAVALRFVTVLFSTAEGSSFLRGEKGSGEHKNWKANFDWVIKPANMTKILEGAYND